MQITTHHRHFKQNQMNSNNDKCHLMIINNEDNIINSEGEEIRGGNQSVKLLGVTIDNKLNFNEHVTNIYIKATKSFMH